MVSTQEIVLVNLVSMEGYAASTSIEMMCGRARNMSGEVRNLR